MIKIKPKMKKKRQSGHIWLLCHKIWDEAELKEDGSKDCRNGLLCYREGMSFNSIKNDQVWSLSITPTL